MYTKKLLALLLIATMLVFAVGCSRSPDLVATHYQYDGMVNIRFEAQAKGDTVSELTVILKINKADASPSIIESFKQAKSFKNTSSVKLKTKDTGEEMTLTYIFNMDPISLTMLQNIFGVSSKHSDFISLSELKELLESGGYTIEKYSEK